MHHEIDTEGRLAMQRTRRVFELFQSIDPNMTLGAMASFLTIAEADAPSVTDLKRAMKVSKSAASRYSRYLGKVDRHGNKGLELVAESANPLDPRKKVLTPTPRGELVLTQLTGIFGHSSRSRKQKAPVMGAPLGAL